MRHLFNIHTHIHLWRCVFFLASAILCLCWWCWVSAFCYRYKCDSTKRECAHAHTTVTKESVGIVASKSLESAKLSVIFISTSKVKYSIYTVHKFLRLNNTYIFVYCVRCTRDSIVYVYVRTRKSVSRDWQTTPATATKPTTVTQYNKTTYHTYRFTHTKYEYTSSKDLSSQ